MENIKAWTGGSIPAPIDAVSKAERRLITKLFREQLKIWLDYWEDMPNKDTRGIFWNRARYDAHATCRKPSKWERM